MCVLILMVDETFRTFDGSTPVLLVYDPLWVKEAFIKNFNVFIERRRFPLGSAIDNGLFSISGEHWKFARKMLSPEFSSGKLKKVCSNTLAQKML